MKSENYFEIVCSSKERVVKVLLSKFENLEQAVLFCRFTLKFFNYDHISIEPFSSE